MQELLGLLHKYIGNSLLDIFSMWYAQVCTNVEHNNCVRALVTRLILRLTPFVGVLFFIRYVVVTTGAKQMAFTHAHC